MVQTLVTGTSNSHQRVRPEQVAGLQIVIAPASVFTAFADIAKPLLQRVGENRQASDMFGTLRDTLLPRLMSGKLRIPEAEAWIEEAIA